MGEQKFQTINLKNIGPRFLSRDLRSRPTRAMTQQEIADVVSDAFVRVVTSWIGHRGVDYRLAVINAIHEALLVVELPVAIDVNKLMIIIEPHEDKELVDVTIRERNALDDMAEASRD